MKLIKKFMPHLTVSLMLVLITVVIFNNFNPRMGFLQGNVANILILSACVCSIITAVMQIAASFKDN